MDRTRVRIGLLAALAALALPSGADAQMKPLAFEVRGGLNWAIGDLKDGLGDINQDGIEQAQAEQHGWTLGGDLFWTFHERGAVYAGYNWAKFDCKDEECGSDGFLYAQGPEIGFKFSTTGDRSFNPWVRIGVTATKSKWTEGNVEEISNRAIGLDVGVGSDIALTDNFRLVPAVRFYRSNPSWDVGSIGETRVDRNVGWFQTDIGLQYRMGG